ncbi:MAG: calcium-translocating P-type ATPase, PMCA-type [Candidatus Bathyarchaeota archaeon]|nr:MAG: calcium-translocating P-type ATPase, PMCA-type [Candidatus Bathyarchaeota archaeon]
MGNAWHSKTIESVLEELHTDSLGLGSGEIKERLEKYGPNKLVERKGTSALQIFINQFKDIFVIMLLIATAIAFFAAYAQNEPQTDTATIAAIVVLNSIVGFVQEYRSEKAMEAMKKLTAPKARLMRDGKEVIIPAEEVVPGDILLLESGDRIPADSRLIEVVDLRTDEAVLTGESTQVEKGIGAVLSETPVADRKNMVFTATYVTYGRGKAVVTSTGMNTEFGKIAEMVQTVKVEETPLKLKLESFAKKLGIIIVIISALIFILEILDPARSGQIIESFIIAIALAVSAVPEGLPAVVTISLALGARELAKRNAIIRRLASAETLGATTVICSDKTGTLTKGEMTVRRLFTCDQFFEVTGVGYQAKGNFLLNDKSITAKKDPNLSLLLAASVACTNASYDGTRIIGDTTEGALIVAAAKAGITKNEVEKDYSRVHEIPFTSERKRMTTIHQTPERKLFAFMKGAPEVILNRCGRILKDGETRKLTEKEKEKILKINENMASSALRVLGIAFKELVDIDVDDFQEKSEEEKINKRVETGLIFIGLAGMIDPPREEAKEANRICQQAGIKTIMITGDHKLTAVAVAEEIGIATRNPGKIALTGSELDSMSDEDFEIIVEEVRVYARVSPEHKLRIVRALKKKGEIVAMTGDGVNDAPALKQADIGVAMGITGTDVTKEAADMVLADDNFATIVTAVEGGRTVYDNIRKFSFFLMRSNFDELALIGTFALLGLELPLTAGMILWLNLVTDGGPALALATDPPEKDLMERPPRNPKEGILSGRLASIIATFTMQFVLTGGLFYWQYYLLPGALTPMKLAQARTMAFTRATLQELFVVWNCRSEKHNAFKTGLFTNKFLVIAVIGSAILTILVPFIGLFGTVVMTDPLEWILVIIASMSGLLIFPEIFYNRKVFKWR